MKNTIPKKLGAALVIVAAVAYAIYRVGSIASAYSIPNLLAAICELTLLALVCVETVLLSSGGTRPARKQDEGVLIESAKSVLFSSQAHHTQSQGTTSTRTHTDQVIASGSYETAPVDAVVFAEEATDEELRRCFLSLDLIDEIANVYVIDDSLSSQREELTKEFSFHAVESFAHLVATTDKVLICRGTDILYPDACKIARTYDVRGAGFLELRSVYSDERALGNNGVIEVSDKRQLIREALATRGLSTWSTGPALVQADVISTNLKATTAVAFFRSCERKGIHGYITEEVVSEEISHEQTISEVEWRALDFAYTAGAWRHSYKASGQRITGLWVKAWSAFVNISLVRRIATVGMILAFALAPTHFGFVTTSYVAIAAATIAVIMAGSYISGDKRGVFARIREFYFDIEAVMYSAYKSLIKPEMRASDKSIVKKLPSVSFLLVLTDAALVYRVIRQYNNEFATGVDRLLKFGSLFAGYALLVSLLIGLGMVIVRQSRSAMRREISRGANINSEPVSMIDLSPGGAGCISVSGMDVDSTVEFESSLPTGTENTKFSCSAIVRSSMPWNDSYRIGLSFVDLDQKQRDTLETYCSIVYPHEQARQTFEGSQVGAVKIGKINGKSEKRILSYAATFIALGAIIFSNLSSFR